MNKKESTKVGQREAQWQWQSLATTPLITWLLSVEFKWWDGRTESLTSTHARATKHNKKSCVCDTKKSQAKYM